MQPSIHSDGHYVLRQIPRTQSSYMTESLHPLTAPHFSPPPALATSTPLSSYGFLTSLEISCNFNLAIYFLTLSEFLVRKRMEAGDSKSFDPGTRLSCWLLGSGVFLGHPGAFNSHSPAVTMEEMRRGQGPVVCWQCFALPGQKHRHTERFQQKLPIEKWKQFG